jgi:hypothetical protein
VEAPRLGHAAGPDLASEHAYAMILHIYTTKSFFGGFPVTKITDDQIRQKRAWHEIFKPSRPNSLLLLE